MASGGRALAVTCLPAAQHGPEPSTFRLLSALGCLCPLLSSPPGRVSHGPPGVPSLDTACAPSRAARFTSVRGNPGLGFPSGLLAGAHIACFPPAFVSPPLTLPLSSGCLAVPPRLQPQSRLRAFARAAPAACSSLPQTSTQPPGAPRPAPQSRTWHAGGILWCLAKWTSSRCRRAHAVRSHLRPVRPSACCPAGAQQISLSLVQAEGSKVCPEQGGVVPLFERDFLEKGPRGGPGQSIGRKESQAWGAQADPRQLPGGGILCFWPQSQAVPERGSACSVGRRGWGADEQGSDRHALPGPLPLRLLAALGAELGEGRVWALCLMIPRSSPWSCRCVCQTVGEQKGVVPRPRSSVQLLVKVAAGLGVPLPPCRAATEQQSGEK